MQKIKQLPKHEAEKIAAGEVVERPANIVKELVENSIDAGAHTITIHLHDGGKERIRIQDDGCGMDAQDARLCFSRHATSKITSINELEQITTHGFRGEALASISAVAQVTLQTREAESDHGTCVVTENSIIKESTVTACNTGTDIVIEKLFDAIPARKKFLKRRETEWRQVVQLTHAFCLAYPNISFTLLHEEQQTLRCTPVQTISERALQLWQQHHQDALLTITGNKEKTITINGVISDRHSMRYDRGGIFIFVNKRWISSRTLTRALMNGYQNVLPPGRFPYAAIDITVDPTLVDVNVHPRKEEVSFLHPRAIEQLLTRIIKEALDTQVADQLSSQQTTPTTWSASTPPIPQSKPFTPFDFDSLPKEEVTSKISTAPATKPTTHTPPPTTSTPFREESPVKAQVGETQPLPTTNTQKTIIPTESYTPLTIVGQFAKTYILIEKKEGLLCVDQHAAHECILFELFKKRFQDLPTIQLAFPHVISLTADDMQLLEPHLETFKQNGIQIEPFGENQLVVSATPVHLKHINLEELVRSTAGWIRENSDASIESIHTALRAQMACKAAVKAGDELEHSKMEQLLRDLEKTENRLTCPHGRPTTWLLRLGEIEKMFQRRA